MKKSIIAIISLTLLTICLSACSHAPNENKPSDGNTDTSLPSDDNKEKTVYETLDALCKKIADKVMVTISTTTNEIPLTAVYIVDKDMVNYSVEQLSLLPTDEIFESIDENYKKTITGSAKISSEKVDSLLNEIVRSERDIKSLNLEQTLRTKTTV